jgi:hypothetical protein
MQWKFKIELKLENFIIFIQQHIHCNWKKRCKDNTSIRFFPPYHQRNPPPIFTLKWCYKLCYSTTNQGFPKFQQIESVLPLKWCCSKINNGLIWGPNTEWTFSKSTESPYAFCAKNINIENSKIIKFIFIVTRTDRLSQNIQIWKPVNQISHPLTILKITEASSTS